MPLQRRTLLQHMLAGTAVAATPAFAQQTANTLRIVVGYPAGATSDALTRVVAEQMGKTLKQPVIVENKAGAGGRIGNEVVKAAAPDGSTLLMTPVATMSIFPHSYAGQLRYDAFKDFMPVAHLSNFQLGLAVNAQVPAKTLAEYVALVKADPAKYGFYASAAAGSLPHFFGVMFGKSAGISLTHVPYKGTAPAMQALASGEVVGAVDRGGRHQVGDGRRQGAPAGRGRREARRHAARRADVPRTGLRPGGAALVCAVRAGRHAAGRDRAPEQGSDRGGAGSGHPQAPGGDEPGAHRLRARAPRHRSCATTTSVGGR